MSDETNPWTSTISAKPDSNTQRIVITCVMRDGVETKYRLLAYNKGQWWTQDEKSPIVGYEPTHWKPIPHGARHGA